MDPPKMSCSERMRLHHSSIALSLIAALSACSARHDKNPNAKPAQENTPTEVANPMASFARMVGGEWRMIVQSGAGMFDTWHWGPGRRSLRVMTHGESAAGEPWRELSVVYWHPARRQTCRFGVGPFRQSLWDGTMTFDGHTATGVSDLYQTSDHRKMGLRWTFDGPDKYHDVLLEDSGAGLKTLAEWDRVRATTLTPVSPPPADKLPKFPERLKALESLQGHTWETTGHAAGDLANEALSHIQSTVEWVPFADGIYVRVMAHRKGGEPLHLLDAYVYHHTGTGALRCLAISYRGGVYEGNIKVLDAGALQLDLTCQESGHVVPRVPRVMRLDLEKDDTVRHRLWSLDGADRTLVLDTHHRKLESGKK